MSHTRNQPDGTPSSAPAGGLSRELKEVLAFTEAENAKHRAFFEMLYKWTAGSLTIIVVVVGGLIAFVGWHTISDLRKQAQDATQAEIASLQNQSQKIVLEEINRERGEVFNRIRAEVKNQFEGAAIRQTVTEAAKTQTHDAMMPIIKTEVRTQVNRGVQDEQRIIRSTLTDQTKDAVRQLMPQIDRDVKSRMNEVVDSSVKSEISNHIAPQLTKLDADAKASSLIVGAESGDAADFDELESVSWRHDLDPTLVADTKRVVESIMQSHNRVYSPLSVEGQDQVRDPIKLIHSSDPLQRRAAIDGSSNDYFKSHLTDLYELMLSDPALDVREAAYVKFKQITGARFLNLDSEAAIEWRSRHSKDFQ